MNKAYNAINWKNEPSTSTAINETNLNKMDRAIDTIDNRVISLDSEKVSKEDGKSLVSNTDISKIGANETAIQTHISNKSNPHSVTKTQVGLGNVDNTSDVNKPISTAQQAEFDAINNNLDGLGYGEIAGGKNLLDKYKVFSALVDNNGSPKTTEIVLKPNTKYTVSTTLPKNNNNSANLFAYNSSGSASTGMNGVWNGQTRTVTTNEDGKIIFYYRLVDFTTMTKAYFLSFDFQLEEGESATSHEEYIPSVKMLAEEVNAQNESLSVIGKCKNLLKPTLATTTQNGVTCTNNGDGTFTLNGTASANATFRVSELKIQEYLGKTLRLVGCPKNGSSTTYHMFFTDNQNSNSSLTDLGEGATKIVEQWGSGKYWVCYINIVSGVTVSNLVFKPMLTEDLSSTYDDFVPYTGDGETLTHDVAELKSDLSKQCKKDDITTNETLIGTFNGKNYYRRLFTGIRGSGSSVTVNVGEKIEIYNYYGRAYTYGQSGASDAKYPIPNKNYYIDSQNASETSFQLTIPTSSDMRKIDLVIEYTKVDE